MLDYDGLFVPSYHQLFWSWLCLIIVFSNCYFIAEKLGFILWIALANVKDGIRLQILVIVTTGWYDCQNWCKPMLNFVIHIFFIIGKWRNQRRNCSSIWKHAILIGDHFYWKILAKLISISWHGYVFVPTNRIRYVIDVDRRVIVSWLNAIMYTVRACEFICRKCSHSYKHKPFLCVWSPWCLH